jgi:hypothetical protein
MSGGAPPPVAGLCDLCAHRRLVASPRSSFVRCGRSDSDPRFPRYPRLPVLDCPGFEPGGMATPGEGPPRGTLG